MAGLFDTARPLDRFRTLLAPDPGWQYGTGILPMKSRTPLDPIYGAPQIMETEFAWAIPGMAREMAGSLLNVLEAPRTGVMPTPADILNVTPMTSAPGLLAKIPAGAMASGMARRAAAPEPAARSPLGFYSPTEQAALDLKQTKLTPDQARASLANLGAKKEEMQWIGLDEFLAGRTSVTQDELLDFVRQNRVNVEQVTYGGPDPEEFIRQSEDLLEQGTRLQEQGDLAGARELFYQHDELMRQNRSLLEMPVGQAPRHSHPNLQIPGGENYREVVLKLPYGDALAAQKIDDRIRTIDTNLNNIRHVLDWQDPERAKVHAQRDKLLQERATLVAKRGALGDVTDYRGGHFPDVNILAHVRMNDRIDADGKKVLFIEEIQSDWHQKGRREGYKVEGDTIIEGKTHLEWDREARRLLGEGIANDPMKRAAWELAISRRDELQQRGRGGGVPDAPFKQTWSDLAMKRIMQMAADGGYDRVAWTTGRMQADRYDLSKQVSEVHYSGTNLVAYDLDGNSVIRQTGVKESDLPDLIGKEAADKLLAQKPDPDRWTDGTLRSLVGQDLQVGGEGMVKFYDQMLPKKAQKIARRLDKDAKVGTREIDAGDEVYSILNQHDVPIGHGYSRAEAEIRVAERPTMHRMVLESGGSHKVWSIDITPAMRGAVQQHGQPLFANPGAAAIPGLLSTQQPAPSLLLQTDDGT